MSSTVSNSTAVRSTDREPALEAFFLGTVDFESCLALQHRLVYESTGRRDGQVSLLLCEHHEIVTVGRQGSHAHLRLGDDELRQRGLTVRWINRGGGCLWHGPGQLAVYPIVPLEFYGLTVGEFLDRFVGAIAATLSDCQAHGLIRNGRRGVWSRSGQLAAVGVAVKDWTTYHGAVINVSPPANAWRGIVTDPIEFTRMSSLAAERPHPARMTQVRATIVRHVAESLGIGRTHVYTGHPLLRTVRPAAPASVAHA